MKPINTTSSAVLPPSRLHVWGMKESRRARFFSFSRVQSCPAATHLPRIGRKPQAAWSMVVLPLPFSPSSAQNSPARDAQAHAVDNLPLPVGDRDVLQAKKLVHSVSFPRLHMKYSSIGTPMAVVRMEMGSSAL